MKNLFTTLLLFFAFFCFGQKPAIREKAHNIYFYKSDGLSEVSTKDSAEIIQIVSEPDSGSALYNVEEFYKNGVLRFAGSSSTLHPAYLQDQGIHYFANGRKKLITNYEDGQCIGRSYYYYPNGKVCYVINCLKKDSLDTKKRKVVYRDTLFEAAYDSAGKATLENGYGHLTKYDSLLRTLKKKGW
ncbi:toxin-antitoxin system YwqK family antitoxin [Mucilaginibacter ginkgonis]|uniref:MORN repeat protein n=1 Tax=Mucilaginibacter ginkgonis TaxID=2682091 RepID=A0A6I4HZ46_9SPHI|nr:hypothetical protein [Mucilaginibacter ginkgonis]QQL49356.1 hypothetical protein GO620_014440 [Mucilaginibacter ginkgonis]